ncbi:MCT1A protease, partial [Polyodon spathula]|nr:MCT1A protease [Polyodon spathula]
VSFLLTQLVYCNCLSASFDSGIINGKKAKVNSLSYMASIQMNGKHKCGGFLIRNNFVMTAAHCNVSGNSLSVVLGPHNLNDVQDSQRFSVASFTRHNKYTGKPLQNDIMLLQLKPPVKLNKKMKLATLPKKEKQLKNGTKCIVAGWGVTKTEKPTTANLQVVDVTVVDKEECKKVWNKFKTEITAEMICAGGYKTDKGACQGDSGGPLMCNGVATGIVSFNRGGNCNYPDVPNVYTSISSYLPWIKKILKKAN